MYQKIFEGQKGHADLFVENNKNVIKLKSIKGKGYYFDKNTKKWDLYENEHFVVVVADWLENEIINYRDEIAGEESLNVDKYSNVKKILDKVRTFNHCKNVWKFARMELVDKNFILK